MIASRDSGTASNLGHGGVRIGVRSPPGRRCMSRVIGPSADNVTATSLGTCIRLDEETLTIGGKYDMSLPLRGVSVAHSEHIPRAARGWRGSPIRPPLHPMRPARCQSLS